MDKRRYKFSFFFTGLVLTILTSATYAGFTPRYTYGFPKLTLQVARDTIEVDLFADVYGCQWLHFACGYDISVFTDPKWNRLVYIISTDGGNNPSEPMGEIGRNEFSYPHGISGMVVEDTVGVLYIADTDNNRIVQREFRRRYVPPGVWIWSFAVVRTFGEGVLNHPWGVRASGGHVYITDAYNGRIVRYDTSGVNPIFFGSYGVGASHFAQPRGITVRCDTIYVTDGTNNRLVMLKDLGSTFQWIQTIDVTDKPELFLTDVSVDSHGNVFAVDLLNDRLLKFAPGLSSYMGDFGSHGTGLGQFIHPHAFGMYPDTGRVMVTEEWDLQTGISSWALTVKVYDANCSSTPFYPLAEGATTPIKFKVDDTAHVYITITGKRTGIDDCNFIRHDSLKNLRPGVEYTYNWDGRADDERLCPPDSFSVLLHPVDAFPGGTYESEDTTLTTLVIGGTLHAGDVINKMLWTPLGNPHVLWPSANYYPILVPLDSQLVIQPGVEVYMVPARLPPESAQYEPCTYQPYLLNSGHITAVGKPDSIILFSEYERTSLRQPGYWGGVIDGGSWYSGEIIPDPFPEDSISQYKHCLFEYGGRPFEHYPSSGFAKVRDKRYLNVNESNVPQDSIGQMFWNFRAPRVEQCTLRYSWGWALFGHPKCYPRVTNCRFHGNLGYPVRLGANGYYKVTECTFDTNGPRFGDNAVYLGAEAVTGSPVWRYQGVPLDIPEVDEGQPLILVAQAGANDTLTLEPNLTLRFWSGFGLQVGDSLKTSRPPGELIADGTTGQITFTAMDSVRGDTTTRRLWAGITFRTGGNGSLLKNCQIAYVDSAHSGVYSLRDRPTIQGCTFKGNYKPIYVLASGLGRVKDNQFDGNSMNEIWGLADTVRDDATWQNQSVPYVIDFNDGFSTMVVSGTDGPDGVTTLTIDPGIAIRFVNLEVGGPRNIEVGTAGQPGALWADGSASQISFRGDTTETWGGFVFGPGTDSSKTLLDSVEIYGTGYPPLSLKSQYPHQPIIRCNGCSPALRNLDLRGNEGIGLKISGGAPILYKNTIAQNDTGIYCTNSANPVMTGNKIHSNNYFGLVNDDQNVTINAVNTWWGHESGPLDDSQGSPDYNPCGQGNKVSDYVSYRPWLIDPGYGPMVSLSAGAGEYNNSQKFVKDWWGWVHAVYRSGNSVFYSYSSNQGTSWTERQLLGEGIYPTIAHDGEDSLHACWIKQADPGICSFDTLARIYYSYKDSNGNWSSPCTLVAENSYYSPRVLYSPPAIDVLSDTVRIAYERTQASMAMMGWNIDWKLYYGSFPVHNPGAVQWKALDSLYLGYVPFMPSTPIAPSINVDFNSMSHVVWQKQGVVYYKEQLQDTVWSAIKTLSADSLSTASFPSSNLYGSRLSAVWEEAIEEDNSVIHYRGRWLGEDWESDQTLPSAGSHSHRPVVDANAVVSWCENVDSLNSEIYYTKWNWYEWTTPTNVSNTSARSYDPHLIAIQFMMGSDYQFLWTEGDSAPFQMTYLDIFSPWMANPWMSPWYSSDVGRVKFSPFTVEREGYLSYGSSRQKTIDYGSHTLVGEGVDAGSNGLAYQFNRLDTTYCYRLELVAYFEKKEGKSGENSDAEDPRNSSATLDDKGEDKINQSVLLNGQKVGEMELVPGQPDTFSFVIPKDMYRRGRLEFVLDKKNGKFACLSELALYRWKEKVKNGAQTQGGGPQGSGGVELLPKVYELSQSYPNPARDRVTIRYALPKASQVNLSVYNISGQLIRKLVNASQKPAYHVVHWDGRDESGRRISNGVYLYRMQAGDFAKTRKLVVIR